MTDHPVPLNQQPFNLIKTDILINLTLLMKIKQDKKEIKKKLRSSINELFRSHEIEGISLSLTKEFHDKVDKDIELHGPVGSKDKNCVVCRLSK